MFQSAIDVGINPALFAAFVLRSPQDDDQDEDGTENGKSSIPAWSYATSLSRTYIEETENCRSKSLVTNGLSNSSWNLGM